MNDSKSDTPESSSEASLSSRAGNDENASPLSSRQSSSENLRKAEALFEKGDYASSRAIASPLARSENTDEAHLAQALLAQMTPAPLVKYMLLLTTLLLLTVTLFAYSQ